MENTRRLFHPGRIVCTPGALTLLKRSTTSAGRLLFRHLRGDWGDMPPEDKALNESALLNGSRLMSAYVFPSGKRLWIITEAGEKWQRPYTTLLLPSEY